MAQKGKAFFSDDDFDNEKGDAELLQYDEEEATRDLTNVASLPSTAKHSTALRKSETGAEYLPVPVGGLNVYFNRHVGTQKSRKRTLSKRSCCPCVYLSSDYLSSHPSPLLAAPPKSPWTQTRGAKLP